MNREQSARSMPGKRWGRGYSNGACVQTTQERGQELNARRVEQQDPLPFGTDRLKGSGNCSGPRVESGKPEVLCRFLTPIQKGEGRSLWGLQGPGAQEIHEVVGVF
jgi:hypothetical protein